MCHDRERLIDYIYDECAAGERQQIEEHLAGCPACRQEVAGLRAVRQDLLAWDVPSHASIWRPVPVAAPVTWRAVPGWALAAAASLMVLSGVVGGLTAQALLAPAGVDGPQAAAVQSAAPALSVSAPQVAPAAADIAELERRLSTRIRAELQADFDARLRRVALQQGQAPSEEMRDLLTRLNNDVVVVRRGLRSVEGKVEGVMALAEPRAIPVSFQGQ
jgi:anti-sigma factor RsiW